MSYPSADGAGPEHKAGITRGDLVKRTLAGGAVLGVGGLVAACDSDSETESGGGSSPASAPPKRGGNLRVALPSGGTAETLNPGRGALIIDEARMRALFEGLVFVNHENKLEPRLATEWSPSSDAMLWRIKLRRGVTFHDGKPFTADDVLYTIRSWGDPASFAHSTAVVMDLKGLKKVNSHEIAIPLLSPNARLLDLFTYFNNLIVQDGEKNFNRPIGTGPFKFKSFNAGQRSEFEANPDYWQSGKPYVNSLAILSIEDPGARFNAVRGGQADMMGSLPYADAKQAVDSGDKSIKILDGKTPSFVCFYVHTGKPPFDDVRVREALKLAVDRQALIDGAYAGFATLGNDIPGKGLPFFDSSLPQRTQDIEKAKSLLKAAGHDTLPVTLTTSEGSAGQVEAATLCAEQIGPAGFKAKLNKIQPGTYYTPPPSGVYLTMSFAQDLWPTTSLQTSYRQLLLPGAPFPQTHFEDPDFTSIVKKAIGTLDETKATDLWHQAQKILYDTGGYVIHAQANFVDATTPNVAGLTPGGPVDMGGFPFEDVHFTS